MAVDLAVASSSDHEGQLGEIRADPALLAKHSSSLGSFCLRWELIVALDAQDLDPLIAVTN